MPDRRSIGALLVLCVLFFPLIPLSRADPPATEGDDPWPVKITPDLPYIDLPNLHEGKTIRLQREQDQDAMIDFDFAYIARPCLPFCIQPMRLSPGIETIGELEVIDYLKRLSQGDGSILVIDSRTPNWLDKGIIPGAVNIPWKKLHFGHVDQETLMNILEFEFGVTRHENLLNFEHAKTLAFYCNGNWCGQSVTSIRSLRMLGYPPHKLKWYRAGMQGWKMLGLTTVVPTRKDESP